MIDNKFRIKNNYFGLIDVDGNPIKPTNPLPVTISNVNRIPLYQYFTNETYGREMNQDATFTGTPDNVYLDNAEWTMTAPVGTWDFNSASPVQAGTKAIDGTGTADGDIAQAKRSSTIDLSSYGFFAGYIYLVGSTIGAQLLVYAYDTSTGLTVGNSVDILDYLATTSTGSYLRFIIPLEDMGIESSTIDTFRFQVVNNPPPFDFHLDTLTLEQSGALVYKMEPPAGTLFSINRLTVIFRRNGVINYDVNTFLGITVSMPAIFRVGIAGTILPAGTHYSIGDLMETTGSQFLNIPDTVNSNAFIDVTYNPPITLSSATSDFIDVILADDFSGLDRLRVQAAGDVTLIT